MGECFILGSAGTHAYLIKKGITEHKQMLIHLWQFILFLQVHGSLQCDSKEYIYLLYF
jgi:hypothetical protein